MTIFVKKHISFSHYKNLLYKLKEGDVERLRIRQTQINSKSHSITTQSVRKVALSACVTKIYLLDAFNTLPFGHFKTRKGN